MINRHVQNVIEACARAELAHINAARAFSLALNGTATLREVQELRAAVTRAEADYSACRKSLRTCHIYSDLAE